MKNLPSTEAMFLYLDELRESGETNMFGARPYLMRAFDIPPARATQVLAEWMRTFSKRHAEKERA